MPNYFHADGAHALAANPNRRWNQAYRRIFQALRSEGRGRLKPTAAPSVAAPARQFMVTGPRSAGPDPLPAPMAVMPRNQKRPFRSRAEAIPLEPFQTLGPVFDAQAQGSIEAPLSGPGLDPARFVKVLLLLARSPACPPAGAGFACA